MATAFYGQMTITHPDTTIETDTFTCADTTLIYCLWRSNAGTRDYIVKKDGYITGIRLNITSAGTTKYFKVFLNEQDTGIQMVQSACFPALLRVWPSQAPIPVKAGQVLQIQAIT
jgi:hypothetical protein